MPVSSPEILSPKPKRSPSRGLCLGAKPTPFSALPTKCSEVGGARADPPVASTAALPIAAGGKPDRRTEAQTGTSLRGHDASSSVE